MSFYSPARRAHSDHSFDNVELNKLSTPQKVTLTDYEDHNHPHYPGDPEVLSSTKKQASKGNKMLWTVLGAIVFLTALTVFVIVGMKISHMGAPIMGKLMNTTQPVEWPEITIATPAMPFPTNKDFGKLEKEQRICQEAGLYSSEDVCNQRCRLPPEYEKMCSQVQSSELWECLACKDLSKNPAPTPLSPPLYWPIATSAIPSPLSRIDSTITPTPEIVPAAPESTPPFMSSIASTPPQRTSDDDSPCEKISTFQSLNMCKETCTVDPRRKKNCEEFRGLWSCLSCPL